MAAALRSAKRPRRKGDCDPPPPGSVGRGPSESGCDGDFDSDASADTGEILRKRRRVQASTADSASYVQGIKGMPQKRARPSRHSKYVAGRRGHLKLMTEIPIDTLHEIFRQLDPADLLNLSWSSKSLRLLIMEKSARYIWQEAFERLYQSSNPPPRCPEDLTLPQYTRFLFNKRCMVCDSGPGNWTSWMMRLRACSKCLDSDQFELCDSLLHIDLLTISTKKATYCMSDDVGTADKNATPWMEDDELFFRRKLLKENKLMGECSFRTWENGCVKGREAELDVIRLERKKAILTKLGMHGWTEPDIKEMCFGQIPSDLPGFRRAKRLTSKDWHDLEPKLLQRLDSLKEDHMNRERKMRLKKRWRAFEVRFEAWAHSQDMPLSMLPRVTDIAVFDPFRAVIFGLDTETANFDKDDIDQMCKAWLKDRDDFIYSLLPLDIKNRCGKEQLSSLLSLPILRFRGWTEFATLGEVYDSRENMWDCQPKDLDDIEIRDMLNENIWEFRNTSAPWSWSFENLKFDREAFIIVRDIIRYLELDPYSTTLEDLEDFGGTFMCISCFSSWPPAGRTFSASEMIEHDVTYHGDGSPAWWWTGEGEGESSEDESDEGARRVSLTGF